ncbi:MAG: hypothetical protein E7366_00890 [Clostridiales bacterium]|jgi:hypothetical protein|nr:hypothetical protein [Clostridiales bacterium]
METIQIKLPEGKNKCLLWEYDISNKKGGLFGMGSAKIKVATAPNTAAYLYNMNEKRFEPVRGEIELKKGVAYRLFGMMSDCKSLLTDGNEFRGRLTGETRLVFTNQSSGEKTSFMAPVTVVGTFGFGKVLNGTNFIKAHMDEVTPSEPLYADYTGDSNGFNVRQYFHDTIKTRLFSYIEDCISENSTANGVMLSALESIRGEVNDYALQLSREVYDADRESGWVEIICKVTKIEPMGELYERIKKNFNAAAQHVSNADVLASQYKAAKIAHNIRRELEED